MTALYRQNGELFVRCTQTFHTLSISQYCHLKLWCQSYYSFRLSRGKVSPIIDDIWEPSLLQYNDVHITYSLSYTFNAYSEIQSVNRQDGLTGPKVLIDTIVKNSIKGFESLLVKVNTDPTLGVWVINQNVNIKVELKDTVNTGNNTLKPNTIKEINFISENGFVSNNSVYITSSQITKLIVESNYITDEEWKQTKEILGSVNLTTVPADKNKQPLWSTYNFTMFKS